MIGDKRRQPDNRIYIALPVESVLPFRLASRSDAPKLELAYEVMDAKLDARLALRMCLLVEGNSVKSPTQSWGEWS